MSPKTGGAGRPATVVITDCDHATIDPELEVLGAAGVEVRLEACRTAGDVIAVAADADALLVQYASIDEQVLQALERCRAVVRYGVGVDTVDVEAATRHGVWVVNVPDYGTEEVSDHALALLLALLRGVVWLDRSVRDGMWDVGVAAPLRRVNTLTVGVVGCGRIGGAFARKVAALGLRVIAHDPLGVPDALQQLGVEPAGLDALLASADAVSIHAPLDTGTKHLLGAVQLARMKGGAYLVNTARGGLVDIDALLQALDAGHLAGAALDVLEGEPPAAGDSALAHDRLILTPHAAWYSEESSQTLKAEAAREAVRVISGERPRSPVNNPTPRGPRA